MQRELWIKIPGARPPRPRLRGVRVHQVPALASALNYLRIFNLLSMAKKTASYKAGSGAIPVQPRVYPGLLFGANSGGGRWGRFGAKFDLRRVVRRVYYEETLWANAAINSAWRRAAP